MFGPLFPRAVRLPPCSRDIDATVLPVLVATQRSIVGIPTPAADTTTNDTRR